MANARLSKQARRKANNNSRISTNNSTTSQSVITSFTSRNQDSVLSPELLIFDEILNQFPKWNHIKIVKFVHCLFDELNKNDIVFPSAMMDQDPRRRLFRNICDRLEATILFNNYDNDSQQRLFINFARYFETPFEDYFPWILLLAEKNKRNNSNFYHIFYGVLNYLIDKDVPFTRDNLFYLKTKFNSHLQDEHFSAKTVIMKTMIKIGQKNPLFWNDNYIVAFYPQLINHVYKPSSFEEQSYLFDCLIKPLKPILEDNLELVGKTMHDLLEDIECLLNYFQPTNDASYRMAFKVVSFNHLYQLMCDRFEKNHQIHKHCAILALICWDKVPQADRYFIILIRDFLHFSLESKLFIEYSAGQEIELANIFTVQLLCCLLQQSISSRNADDCLHLFELLNASIHTVCDHNAAANLSHFINLFLSKSVRSSLFNMRIVELFTLMKAVISKLLMIKNHAVQNATIIYNHIIDDLRSALASFEFKQFSYNNSSKNVDNKNARIFCKKLIRSSSVEDDSYKDNDSYRFESVLFNIQLLNEFLICDNSVIFSFALQPNVCDLFIEEIGPFIIAFALSGRYEKRTVWILDQFFSIIKKRKFFISSFVSNNTNNPVVQPFAMKDMLLINPFQLVCLKSEHQSPEKIAIDQKKPFPQNAQHLNHILTFFTNLLSVPNMNLIAARALECVAEIFDAILQCENFHSMIESLYIVPLFSNIAYYSHNDTNMQIVHLSCTLLEQFFTHFDGPKYARVRRIYLTSFLKNILSSKADIRNNSLRMASLLPSKRGLLNICFWKLFKNIDISRHSGHVYPEIIHLSKIVTLNKYNPDLFTDEMFLHVMNASFFGRKPLESSSQIFEQILLHHKSDFKLEHNIKETISYFPFIDYKGFDQYKTLGKNLNIALNWLCWNFVFHSIENRLKTAFGSRQELLSQLSCRITAMVQDDFKDDDKASFDRDSMLMPTETIVSVRLSLNILECFSKAIFNAASRGKTTWLTDFSSPTKLFFKKNFDVCKDWMNRNRRSVMFLALKCGDYGLVIRNGEELLRDYAQNQDILSVEQVKFVMLIMTKALIQLKAPDALRGYALWLQDYAVYMEWGDAAILEASGRFEEALFLYDDLISSQIVRPQPTYFPSLFARNNEFNCSSFIIDFVRDRVVQCHISLGSYDEAVNYKKNNPFSCKNLLNTELDYNYLRELNHFDFEDLSYVSRTCDSYNNYQIWDINACYHSTQASLLRIFKNIIYSSDCDSVREHVDNMQELIDLKLDPLISSIYIAGDSPESFAFMRLHRICYAIKHWLHNADENFITNFFKPSNNNFSLEDCVTYLKWFKIFRKFAWGAYLKPVEQDLQLEIAKLARKSNNLRLAYAASRQFQRSRFGCKDFEDLMKKQFTGDLFQYIHESSKIVLAGDDPQGAVEILANTWHSMLERFQFHPNSTIEPKAAQEAAKIGILLADHIENDSRLFNHNFDWLLQLHSFNKINNYFEEIDPRGLGRSWTELENDRSVRCTGSLLLRATNIAKTLPEAWNRLADWSYKWARRLDDARNTKPDSVRTETRFRTQSEDCEPQTRCYYELSANSYFKYLQYSSESVENVNATLRLLRLILKHAHQLKESIEIGLKTTPTLPWKKIALQLFSRLNHHEAYVRKSITELLCRIGDDDAQLLIFPAIAGCMDKAIQTDEEIFKKEDDSEEEEEAHNTQQCYKLLLQHLEQNNPDMVTETKLFVDELRRITVLWDELWIGTLQNNHQDVIRQVSNLERDIELTRVNTNLFPNEKELFIKEKHQIYFRRILYTLELTKLITSEKAETVHETWFQNTFSKHIDELINSIKNPESFWQPSKILLTFQNTLQLVRKQSFVSISNRLEMHDISFILSGFKNTNIPIPGTKISIQKINNTVTILQTLTKPKKITFVGNDGRYYPHLFKGHEDLHLDERIMQFLSIVNLILSRSEDLSKKRHLLSRARNYSVTPLGSKSGLIEWVSGAQPLYRIYNRWLGSRDFQDPLQESSAKLSPVELFRQKLIKHKLSPDNRSEWSEKTLLAIHEELRKETPSDLLYRELWTASMSGLDYWSISQNYINSCALMSMIGYLLGLGDRHLDNILLDLTTGEMIHIDFNICFEKGETLKVPEKVPCRLTANIVYALGATGTQGSFQSACEEFVKLMRQNREMLLALLEAFVYDPLVDWTPEHEEGYTGAIYGGMRIAQLAAKGKIIPRKQMERENSEALDKLNELMSAVDSRQVDWPQIGLQERIDIVRNGELMLPKAQNAQNLSGTETKKSRRNAYAIGVWKRIKNKFDGKKIVGGEEFRFSITDQVNLIIAQSKDPKNLARMYEGWTSWV